MSRQGRALSVLTVLAADAGDLQAWGESSSCRGENYRRELSTQQWLVTQSLLCTHSITTVEMWLTNLYSSTVATILVIFTTPRYYAGTLGGGQGYTPGLGYSLLHMWVEFGRVVQDVSGMRL